MSWHLFVAATGFTRSPPQPSARFPWINYRSRSQSPPIEFSLMILTSLPTAHRPSWLPVELSALTQRWPTLWHSSPRRQQVQSMRRYPDEPRISQIGPTRQAASGQKKPLRALAVAEDAPAGAYDRQGRGRSQWRRASPEMRPGSHHNGWAATPQAADQPH